METDPEVKEGAGHHYATYFRQYDPRLGRWWSVDPITHLGESPYVAMSDNPSSFVDPTGAATANPRSSSPLEPDPSTRTPKKKKESPSLAELIGQGLKLIGEAGKRLTEQRRSQGARTAIARFMSWMSGGGGDAGRGGMSSGSGTTATAPTAPGFEATETTINVLGIPVMRPNAMWTTLSGFNVLGSVPRQPTTAELSTLSTLPPPVTTDPYVETNGLLKSAAAWRQYLATSRGQEVEQQNAGNPLFQLWNLITSATDEAYVGFTGRHLSGMGADGKERKDARLNLYVFGVSLFLTPEVATARGFLAEGVATASDDVGGIVLRGTSEGYAGGAATQRIGITPVTLDPAVGTNFATHSEQFGRGVLQIATPDD